MIRGVAGALVWAAACAACAQPSSPPGGERDEIPPRVTSVFPAPFDTLEDLRAPVRIEFDERLSIRLQGVREWEDAVLVSPVTGDVRVKPERRALEISVAGGWQRGLVYRVVVLPVFRDLFGNQRVDPVELVFTTGAPIPPTAVVGFVEDRITAQPVAGARVEAMRRLDSITYVAVTDTGGFFALRNVPAGVYDLRGWFDQDRDRRTDFQEIQDTAFVPLGFQDTVFVPLALLPRDTTPARLVRAEPVDSLRVRLFLDDYFPPGRVDGSGTVYLLPDSTPARRMGRLVHPTTLDSILARERAVEDSLRSLEEARRRAAEDSLRRATGDTLPAPPPADTAALPRPPAPAAGLPAGARPRPGGVAPARPTPRPGAAPPSRPLPRRELVLIMPDPLQPDTMYVVRVEGLVNIRGVPGGGGSARFRTPPRDTTPALADSVPPARPDSVRPDSAPVPPVPPDTVGP